MVEVSDSIRIEAAPERVFAYLDDPHNHVEITPSLAAVRDIERLENGGKRATFEYSIAGVSLEGELSERIHEPGQRLCFDLSGDLPGEIDIRLEPDDGATRVLYRATYELPGSILSTVAEPFARRYNEREVRTLLENLGTRLETAESP